MTGDEPGQAAQRDNKNIIGGGSVNKKMKPPQGDFSKHASTGGVMANDGGTATPELGLPAVVAAEGGGGSPVKTKVMTPGHTAR